MIRLSPNLEDICGLNHLPISAMKARPGSFDDSVSSTTLHLRANRPGDKSVIVIEKDRPRTPCTEKSRQETSKMKAD